MISEKQKRMFEMKLDFSMVYSYLKTYKLREYTGYSPTVSLTATSPDEACHLVMKNLKDLLVSQNAKANYFDTFVEPKIRIKKITVKDVW